MIRAEVSNPVGGVIYSPNRLVLLLPWLRGMGLMGCVVAVSFVIKRRII